MFRWRGHILHFFYFMALGAEFGQYLQPIRPSRGISSVYGWMKLVILEFKIYLLIHLRAASQSCRLEVTVGIIARTAWTSQPRLPVLNSS